MGTREKLFRQKLADQIEALLTSSEKVFTSEKLDEEWVSKMLLETQDLTKALTIYQFLHELPEDENLQLAFLELDEQAKTEKEEVVIPNYGDEILKEINEFENQDAEEVFEVKSKKVETEEVTEVILEDIQEVKIIEEEVDKNPTEPIPTESTEEIIIVEAEEEIEVVETTVEEPVEEAPKENTEKPVASKDSPVKTEINDTISSSEPSLAEKLSNKSIKKLAESIALNERFLFSNELFDGNMEAFKRALTELDHIASLEDAQRYIELQLKKDNNWDTDNETVKAFITLVERRF